MKNKIEELSSEKRTIEQLLTDLRKERNWDYINVSEELNKLGVSFDEKQVKKLELGLIHPDLEMIYKLSELYLVSSNDFIAAKNNSYTKDYNSIHMKLIRWICYFTGFTLSLGYVVFYITITLALIVSFIVVMHLLNTFESPF